MAWLLALAALLWFALRNAAIALFAQAQPAFALAFPPPSGEAVAIQAMRGRVAPAEQKAAAALALGRSPVSYWPILAAAEAFLAQGDEQRGIALLEEAVRRNSRNAETRGRLFQLYIAHGRWSEGIDEGLAYARLRSSMADSVMQSFLLLLDDVRGRAVLARKLQARADGSLPRWGERLVMLSAGRPGERRLTELLNRPADATPTQAATEGSIDGYVSWVATLPVEALPHVRGVYDGEFRGLPGAAPFNWALGRGAQIEGGRGVSGGVLVARASGSRPVPLARQLLVLPPGAHRVSVDGSLTRGGPMVWRIACPSGPVLVDLALESGGRPTPVEGHFTVPSGCPLQELVLVASGEGMSRTDSIAIWPRL